MKEHQGHIARKRFCYGRAQGSFNQLSWLTFTEATAKQHE
jgi:hypothetical protein